MKLRSFTNLLKMSAPLNLLITETDEVLIKLLKQNPKAFDPLTNGAIHYAVRRNTTTVAEKLIEIGVDINALDEHEWTALHYAIEYRNMENVCMLLFHNVDITIRCGHLCPLSRALIRGKLEIVEVLLYYCFDDPLSAELVLFIVGLRHKPVYNPGYQDFIWSEQCMKFAFCRRSPDLFVQCLQEVLESTIAKDLGNLSILISDAFRPLTFMTNVLRQLALSGASEDFRLSVLYMCICIGFQIIPSDLAEAYNLFGYGPELEALIYTGDLNWPRVEPIYKELYPLAGFLPFFCTSTSLMDIDMLLSKHDSERMLLNAAKRFCLPPDFKFELRDIYTRKGYRDQELWKLIQPEGVPSLVQLSRDKIRKTIIIKHRYKKMYQYLDAINRMEIPQLLKDIILLKVPLY